MILRPGLPDVPSTALGPGLRGRVARSVAELVAEGLRDSPGCPVWAGIAWWRFAEQDPDHEIAYLVLDLEGQAHAVAPVLLVRGPETLVFYNGPRLVGDFSALGAVGRLDPDEAAAVGAARPALDLARPALYPSLSVGVFGSHLGLRPFDGNRADLNLEVLLPALAELAALVARAWGCPSHALLYLDPDEDAALKVSGASPALRALIGAEAVLDVPQGGFENYLACLSTGRRNQVRREQRAYAEAGLLTRVATGPDALTDEYLPLRSALRTKYGHAAGEQWARDEFAALRRTVGEELIVFSARSGDRVVGYLMAIVRSGVLYTRSAGFDDEAAAGTFCYFNLVYYDVIRWAQQRGIQRIHYGLGTSEAKRHRGCRFVLRWLYLDLPPSAPAEFGEVLGHQHASLARSLSGFGVAPADTRLEMGFA